MDSTNQKLFNRASYSSTTISIFQIVGAYFIDVYYNHLYTEAIKFRTDGKVASVTEGYRHATFAFLSAIDNKSKAYKAEHYNKLLQGINEYFITWTNFSSLTLSECIDKIVREFVPADYFASLNKEQKRNILRSVLIDSIREFTKIVVGEFLGAIIDNHEEAANIEALKEKMVDVFIMRRETIFHKFIDCRSGGQIDEKVDKRFADKLRNEVIRLNGINEGLVNTNKGLTDELDTVRASAAEIVSRYKKLKMRYDAVTEEYRISKDKINDLEESLRLRRESSAPKTSVFADDDEPELFSMEPTTVFTPAATPAATTVQPKTGGLDKPNASLMQANTVQTQVQNQAQAPVKKPTTQATAAQRKPPTQTVAQAKKPATQSQTQAQTQAKKPVAQPQTKKPIAAVRKPAMPEPEESEESESEDEPEEETAEPIQAPAPKKIPDVSKVFKKEETLPSDNEMDAAIASHVVNEPPQDLGKPSSISDIY